tara:strand:+ start:3938 stop:4921 length:984 start_codon:yes stop_codon:yes gene_type:complete
MNLKLIIIIFFFGSSSCNKIASEINTTPNSETNPPVTFKNYQTENVIIIVIDGPRYTETGGDTSHQYQPRLANSLAAQGTIFTNFYNNGVTYTIPGHAAITTGNYQALDNRGGAIPYRASIFQHWLKESGADSSKAWLITSKDKLQVLANSSESSWNNLYMPSTNCGIGGDGLGSGYREDSLTFKQIQNILYTHHPKLTLINFKEPDASGHRNDWNAYLNGIRNTDEYIYQIWNMIQNDAEYANKTTMFVTNDHGRHLDEHLDGFVSHGDGCLGCKHINLFAIGPDFKQGQIALAFREQRDISATVAELMNFYFPTGKGKVMQELFK